VTVKATPRDLNRQYAPKYVALAQKLLRDIASRSLRPGDLLGTEDDLVEQHGLSRATVRHALAMLEKDGFVTRHKARGTFVNRAVESAGEHNLRGTVLVVCSNTMRAELAEDFASMTVLRAIERELANAGFAVQMLGVGENEADDRARLRRFIQQDNFEGICAIDACIEPYRHMLSDVLVVSSCSFYPLASPWVGQDVRAVARECVQYLLDRGHREIAMICSAAIDQKAFGVFAEGYREAFAHAGLRVSRQMLYYSYPGESLAELVEEVLTSPNRPTAVFAENWRVCQTVMAVAAKLDLRVPEDISLVGYGQNILHLASAIPVTTYVPDTENIGATVVALLTAAIDKKTLPEQPTFIKGRFVESVSVCDATR
jgi:LacI family transcriptional regulator